VKSIEWRGLFLGGVGGVFTKGRGKGGEGNLRSRGLFKVGRNQEKY